MFKSLIRTVTAGALLSLAFVVPAAQAQSNKPTFIAVGEQTLVPYGWVDFCNRYQGECATRPMPAEDLKLTPAMMKKINQINRWVNRNIESRSDNEQWGLIDRWDYPTSGFGDCEDFVLLKRRLLMEEGLPRQALLVTVVKDERGDGHAILTVKTNQGEYILDNLRDEVKPWAAVPYKFVKRQSQSDPNLWVSIGEPTSAPLIVSR